MSLLGKLFGKKVEEAKEEVVAGVTQVTLIAVLADGKKNVNALIDLSNAMESKKAADLITDVAFAMRAIYEDFEKDPRDIDVAQNFITYLAPRTVLLATTYAKALGEGKLSEEDREDKEKTLRDAIASFEVFLAKCLENDVDGMEFQSESLRRLLEFQTPTVVNKP